MEPKKIYIHVDISGFNDLEEDIKRLHDVMGEAGKIMAHIRFSCHEFNLRLNENPPAVTDGSVV